MATNTNTNTIHPDFTWTRTTTRPVEAPTGLYTQELAARRRILASMHNLIDTWGDVTTESTEIRHTTR